VTRSWSRAAIALRRTNAPTNLNRRELSPALRRSLTNQREALYEWEHPKTKRGSAGGKGEDKGRTVTHVGIEGTRSARSSVSVDHAHTAARKDWSSGY
jgi:hypothetical protein